jgi:hypothetical protein
MSHKKYQQKKSIFTTTNIVIVGVVLVVAYFVFFQGKSTNQSLPIGASTATLTIVQNNQNLGEIPMSKGKVEIPYTIQNTGTQPVVLKESSTSCMCTEAYLTDSQGKKSGKITMHVPRDLDQVVQPGESLYLVAIFDPNAHGPDATGPITRSVYIDTNSTATPKLTFTFLGNVVK